MSFKHWHSQFEQIAQPFHSLQRNEHYYYTVTRAIQEHKPDVFEGGYPLYKLNALIFVMRKLSNQGENSTHHRLGHGRFIGMHTETAIHLALRDIEELLTSAPAFDRALPEFADLLQDTLRLLRDSMFEEKSPSNSFYWAPYFGLWDKWIISLPGFETLAAEEIGRLRQMEQEHPNHLYWSELAQGWLYFHMRNDEAAWRCLATASQRNGLNAAHLQPLLESLLRIRDWPRLIEWLYNATPLIKGIQYQPLPQLWELWHVAAEHHADAEPRMWEALRSLLPGAVSVYATQLYEWGKWQEWIDLQLSGADTDPLAYRVDTFKPIEREAPALLLPLYHQAAERYLLLKNRDSYKKAVKLLKRLSKLYKKMKKAEEWDRFMELLVSRYSRFRAFMEELRKGKLIP